MPRVEVGWEARRKAVGRAVGRGVGTIRARVKAARGRQRQRFEGQPGLMAQADALAKARVGPAEVRDNGQVDEGGRGLLRTAMRQLHMSARAYNEPSWSSPHPQAGPNHRGPFDRFGAGLAGSEDIETAHLAEAIQYQPRRQS